MNTSNAAVERPLSASLERLLGYLDADADNLSLRSDAFDLALSEGQIELADRLTTEVLNRFPTSLPWRHRAAVVAMARHQWEDARRLLQSLLDEGIDDPVVAYNLAYVDFATGRHEQACATLAPLVEGQTAATPEALTLLLRCLHRIGALEAAMKLFRARIEMSPSASAWGAASLIAIDIGDLDSASAWAEQGLSLDSRQQEAMVAKGTVLLSHGDAEEALKCFDEGLRHHPTDGRTLSGIGMAKLAQMKVDEARAAFVDAVRHMPGHIGTWHGLGWCEVCLQDIPGARTAFEEALALDRNFGESHGALAVVMALQGRVEEASEAIRRASKLDPGGLSAQYAQALLDGETSDPQKFARLARRVLGGRRDIHGKSMLDAVMKRR